MKQIGPRALTAEDLTLAHTAAYLELAQREIRGGFDHLSTGDTTVCKASWEAALGGAGCAVAAVEAVVCGSAPFLAGKMGELDVLLNTYRGYKGVTAAGLDAAEAGLHQAMTDALAAASASGG